LLLGFHSIGGSNRLIVHFESIFMFEHMVQFVNLGCDQ
jgi:hypothetical protein